MKILMKLLEMSPYGCAQRNNNGALPLHRAAQFQVPFDILMVLLRSNPVAAAEQDNRGNTPLHLAYLSCAGPPPEDMLRALIGAYPAALGTTNKQGLTPIMMMNSPQENLVDDYS